MRILALCSVAFVVFGLALSGQSPERAQLATLTEIRLTDTVGARPGGGPGSDHFGRHLDLGGGPVPQQRHPYSIR